MVRVVVASTRIVSVSVSEKGSYRPFSPRTSSFRLSTVRLPDLVWLSVVRDGLTFCAVFSRVVVQDSSPLLFCGSCAWTGTAIAKQKAPEMIDPIKRLLADRNM